MSANLLQHPIETTGEIYDSHEYPIKTKIMPVHDGHGRAIAAVYAGFGDGPEVAAYIVRAVNHHERLLESLTHAAEDCGCSIPERASGHRIGCRVPEWLELLSDAKGHP